MRLPDQHLSADEIEELGKEEGLSGELGDQLRPAREHAESCPACRRRLEVYPTSGAKLEKLRAPQGTQKGPDCPPIETWLQLAGGLLIDSEEKRYTAHAAQCDHCGPVLKAIINDFSKPVTEEEKVLVSGLEVHHTALLQAKAAPSPSRSTGWAYLPGKLLPVYGVAAIVVLISATSLWFWYQSRQPAAVNALLNRAYTEQRNLQMRFAGADFGFVKLERGSTSHTSASPSLLEAERRIASYKNNENPDWLHVQGRAQLLENEYDDAIASLGRALDLSPKSPSILVDLASAYFQKALSGGSDLDYGIALNYLGEALALDPSNLVAVFNRAIVEEKLFLYPKAVEDWEEYLHLDPSSRWATEARERLAAVRKKLAARNTTMQRPLLGIDDLIAVTSPETDRNLSAEIEPRVEEYIETALPTWLPDAYSHRERLPALYTLASILLLKHSDPWLRDFLVATPSSKLAESAIDNLSQAIRANTFHDATESGFIFAQRAARLFSMVQSRPGVLRALQEELYDLRLSFKSKECLALAKKLEGMLDKTNYQFMAAQIFLEESSCSVREGRESQGLVAVQRASQRARIGHYPSQQINVMNYESSLHNLSGDSRKTWQECRVALQLFWDGAYPDKRAYSFYVRLADWSEQNQMPRTFLLMADEAARLIDQTNLTAFRAMAHFRFAEAAVSAGETMLAEAEFRQAGDLFGQIKDHNQQNTAIANAQIFLAHAEAEAGKYDAALTRLNDFAPQIERLESVLVRHTYYSTRAGVLSSLDRIEQAAGDYQQAVQAAETLLKYVADERQRLSWARQFGAAYRGLSEVLLRGGHYQDALNVWELYRSSDLRSFASGTGKAGTASRNGLSFGVPTGVAVTAQQSPALHNSLAVVYLVTANTLWVWLIDDTGSEIRSTALRREDLVSTAHHLSLLCADREADIGSIRSEAHKLYDWLIKPIEDRLPTSGSLIVEPDDDLANFPFETLVNSHGEYLIENHTISYVPSLSYLLHLRQDVLPSNPSALLVGLSSVPQKVGHVLVPLEDAEGEAVALADRFVNSRRLIGKDATASAIRNALPDANIFHIATHSIYDNGHLTFPTADSNNLLDLNQLEKREFRKTYVVTMAACSTGGAPGMSFHIAANIVRSLLQAQVPHIVASRWQIDSGATFELMTLFYDNLMQRKTVVQSLREAENTIRQKYGHPFYWAAFSEYGI